MSARRHQLLSLSQLLSACIVKPLYNTRIDYTAIRNAAAPTIIAYKAREMAGKPFRKYYLFDLSCARVAEGSLSDIMSRFGGKECTYRTALSRGSVIAGKYYLSTKKKFTPGHKKNQHNPLLKIKEHGLSSI